MQMAISLAIDNLNTMLMPSLESKQYVSGNDAEMTNKFVKIQLRANSL